MLLKIDLWFLAKADKYVKYLDRYFAKPGKHRPKSVFTS